MLRITMMAVLALLEAPLFADQFGEPIPAGGNVLSLKEAIALLDEGTAPLIKVHGKVTQVCQKKGCFMVLAEGEQFARITFKDYGFFIPKDSTGKQALVQGVLTRKVLSADQANHYEEDAGLAAVYETEVTEYAIVANSVVIN